MGIKHWDFDEKGQVFNDQNLNDAFYYRCDSCTDNIATKVLRQKDEWVPYCAECAEELTAHEPNCIIYICTCTRSNA